MVSGTGDTIQGIVPNCGDGGQCFFDDNRIEHARNTGGTNNGYLMSYDGFQTTVGSVWHYHIEGKILTISGLAPTATMTRR